MTKIARRLILLGMMLAAAGCTLGHLLRRPPILRVIYKDGEWMGGDLWLVDGVGGATRLTLNIAVREAVISDDGSRVAFVCQEAPGRIQLRAIDIDGRNERILLSAEQIAALRPPSEGIYETSISQMAFIPFTHKLLFNTGGTSVSEMGFGYDDLLALDADTGELKTLLPPGEGGNFVVSPDGRQVVLVRPNSIGLVESDGANLRANLLVFERVLTHGEYSFYPQPVWAPDSSSVGIVVPSTDPMDVDTYGTVWRIPVDGGAPAVMGVIPGRFSSPLYYAPLVSPGLARIASTRQERSGAPVLYLSESDGGDEARYDWLPREWWGWAPDSLHFIYTRNEAHGDAGAVSLSYKTPFSRTGAGRLKGGRAMSNDTPLGRGSVRTWCHDWFASASRGAEVTVQMGVLGGAPTALPMGVGFRWVNGETYLYLRADLESWTLTRGGLDASDRPLAVLQGDCASFDFAWVEGD